MPATVIVNKQTVVHVKSDGTSAATPDVCLTPSGPAAVPVIYVNTAESKDSAATSTTVFMDGQPIMLKESFFSKSTGDEGGTAGGGIISGKILGKASFLNYSFDVFVETQNTPRRLDPMQQNHGSPANTASPALTQPNIDAEKDIICAAICLCHWLVGAPQNVRNSILRAIKVPDFLMPSDDLANMGKQGCVDNVLAKSRAAPGGIYHDSYHPNIHIEVPYDVPSGRALMSTSQTSNFHRNVTGMPRALPRSYPGWWLFGRTPGTTGIPDVVITHNPMLPPEGANIARVVEIKFPPDKITDEQRRKYRAIDPQGRDPLVLTPEKCGCELELSQEEVVALAAMLAAIIIILDPIPGDEGLLPGLIPLMRGALPTLQRIAPSLQRLVPGLGPAGAAPAGAF